MAQSSDPIQRHAYEVPGDIRRAVEGLAGDQQLGTVVYLLKQGRQSFAELQEGLDVHQQTLTNTLDKLQDGGIVVREDISNNDSSFDTKYEVTEFGKRVLDKLFDAIQPRETSDTLPVAETSCWIENVAEDGPYVVVSAENRSSGETRFVDSPDPDTYMPGPHSGVKKIV